MANRRAAIGSAFMLLSAIGVPAHADDAFTLDCRVTETEKIDSGNPSSRAHVFVASIDLNARKFHVFEDSSRKYHSGRIAAIRAVAADTAQLTAPSEFRHGTEHVKGSGLRLDLRTLTLAETTVLKDGRTTIETIWRGTCEKAPFRPFPANELPAK
jgi:hypothetical protein